MEPITYQNLIISGVEYDRICSLKITQNVNQHATAEFSCQMKLAKGEDFVNRADGNKVITIKTTAQGQPKILFVGTIASVGIDKTGGYGLVSVTLISTSNRLDLKQERKTFQNTSLTYGDIMNRVLNGTGTVNVTVTDKPIGSFIMQYQETDWEFIKRMASQLEASVFPNINTEKPCISVGPPQGGKVITLTQVERTGVAGANGSLGAMSVNALEYCYLGDKIKVNGQVYTVGSSISTFSDARLVTSYGLYRKESFRVTPFYNQKSSGRMFLGTVQAVQGDKVQVYFNEIDSGYDSGGTQWFPYSTAYASSDGSGFYCMPEVGDMVRVFMPSGNERDAFASASVNKNPPENPRDKSWKAPGGKEILLTDDGIYIICEKEKIFINLTKEDGIEIRSNKKIEVISDEGVAITSNKNIYLTANNKINMSVGNSSVLIDKNQISLTANNVYVN